MGTLKAQNIYTNRKCVLNTIATKGVKHVEEIARANVRDLLSLLQWNEENGIHVFRMSSDMFPHITNPKAPSYSISCASKELSAVADFLTSHPHHRVTFHPGQYNVLASPNPTFVQNTVQELQMHADIFDALGCGGDSVMVIHGGGLYGNKEQTLQRWIEQYHILPDSIKKRLVLENCEKCFSIDDCLYISSHTRIPVVLDTHHYECYSILHPDEEVTPLTSVIPLVLETWRQHNIRPKFHVSQQGPGKIGHHSDYITELPDCLLEIPQKYGIEIDIMIEAKAKEHAVLRLMREDYNK